MQTERKQVSFIQAIRQKMEKRQQEIYRQMEQQAEQAKQQTKPPRIVEIHGVLHEVFESRSDIPRDGDTRIVYSGSDSHGNIIHCRVCKKHSSGEVQQKPTKFRIEEIGGILCEVVDAGGDFPNNGNCHTVYKGIGRDKQPILYRKYEQKPATERKLVIEKKPATERKRVTFDL